MTVKSVFAREGRCLRRPQAQFFHNNSSAYPNKLSGTVLPSLSRGAEQLSAPGGRTHVAIFGEDVR